MEGILSRGARRLTEVKHRDIIKKYISPDPISVPTTKANQLLNPEKKMEVLRSFALSGTMHDTKSLGMLLYQTQATVYQRRLWYDQLRICGEHAYAAGALKLYADSVTGMSPMTLSSAWVTSEDSKLVNAGMQLFQRIDLDSNIRDWFIRLGQYGDLFLRPHAQPGTGVEFVDDNIMPSCIDRIDINGRLEGFVWVGDYGQSAASVESNMHSPWSYVHGRIFGSVRKYMAAGMGMYGMTPQVEFGNFNRDPGLQKFVYTTKYGCSLLAEALPIWKRVRMTEDTLLLARVTRGMIYNMYKIKVGGGNYAQAAALTSQYYQFLKRETALDMTSNEWQDAFAPVFAQVQDLYVPTTDDMDVTVEKLGGESANITGIKDYEEEIKQFLAAMNVSKPMLGVEENVGAGALGQNAHKRASINFAKSSQRLLIGGKLMIKRLLQIHYAYLGLNADPTRFDVQFAGISSAEEEEIKNALVSGVEAIEKYMAVLENTYGDKITQDVKEEVFGLLSKRLVGMEELDVMGIISKDKTKKGAIRDSIIKQNDNTFVECRDLLNKAVMCRGDVFNSYVPTNALNSVRLVESVNDKGETIKSSVYSAKFITLEESASVGGDSKVIVEDKEWNPVTVNYNRVEPKKKRSRK